jgi:uncharacterized membrane protein
MQAETFEELAADPSAANEPVGRGADGWNNVGKTERWVSGLAGSALTLLGLRQQTPGGLVMALAGGALLHRSITGHCYAYGALGIDTAERPQGLLASVRAGAGVKVEKSLSINRTPAELYRFWREFENLPRFMSHLESVERTGPRTSHWVAKGPLGIRVEWDAEIHHEQENRLIAWRSIGDPDVDTAGSVHFEPAGGDRGTRVRVVLKYDPPTGKVGAGIARLFGAAPEQQIQEELRRFKQLMESGEIATIEGQTSCRARA